MDVKTTLCAYWVATPMTEEDIMRKSMEKYLIITL